MNTYKQNLSHLENFLDYIQNQRRYSIHTSRAYSNDIRQFVDYLGEDKNILDLNKFDLHEYVTFISRDITSKTLSRKIATLKSLYKFLCDEELIDFNVSKSIKIPKTGKRLPNHVSIDEMKVFFQKTIDEVDINRRDIVVIDIIYSTGIRVSECVSIKIRDIDLNKKTIKVFGKGKKDRIVIFGEKTQKNIKKYLETISNCELNGFLFPARGNKNKIQKKSITTRTIYNIVKKYIKLVSNNEKLGPHSLRHSFATHLLQSGSDLMAIKDLLGHESLASTQIYTHLDTKRMKEIYNRSHPHAKK